MYIYTSLNYNVVDVIRFLTEIQEAFVEYGMYHSNSYYLLPTYFQGNPNLCLGQYSKKGQWGHCNGMICYRM